MKGTGARVVCCALLLAAAAVVPVVNGREASAATAPSARAAATAVAIGDNYFKPRRVWVRRGASVTWRWRGDRRHNVYFTAGPRHPRTCGARRSGRCARRFRRAGVYEYVCIFHGSMAGRIVVRRG